MRSWLPSGLTAKTRLAYVLWKATQSNPRFTILGPSLEAWSSGILVDIDDDGEYVVQPSPRIVDRCAVWKEIEEAIKKLFLYEETFLEMETEVPRNDLEEFLETGRITHDGIATALGGLPKKRHNRFKTWLLDRMECIM